MRASDPAFLQDVLLNLTTNCSGLSSALPVYYRMVSGFSYSV